METEFYNVSISYNELHVQMYICTKFHVLSLIPQLLFYAPITWTKIFALFKYITQYMHKAK